MSIEIHIKILEHAHGLPLPSYATTGSAGLDLIAACQEDIIIQPLTRCLIPTGVAIKLPNNYEAQIRPRSGLALKSGITVLNSPGTIDSDYRGEIAVILINLSKENFTVTRGMRVAQMVIAQVSQATLKPVLVLDESERGVGGFGSTGTN